MQYNYVNSKENEHEKGGSRSDNIGLKAMQQMDESMTTRMEAEQFFPQKVCNSPLHNLIGIICCIAHSSIYSFKISILCYYLFYFKWILMFYMKQF